MEYNVTIRFYGPDEPCDPKVEAIRTLIKKANSTVGKDQYWYLTAALHLLRRDEGEDFYATVHSIGLETPEHKVGKKKCAWCNK